MLKKFFIKTLGVILSVCFVIVVKNVNFSDIFEIPNNVSVTLETLEQLNAEHILGEFVDTKLTEDIWTTGGVKEKKTSMVIKLFGFIPIKKVSVVVCDEKNVYIGGIPLGFSINTNGVLIVGNGRVLTNSTHDINNELQSGDILTQINGMAIYNIDDIKSQLKDCNGEKVNITYNRNGKEINCDIVPIFDNQSNEYKLGVWIKNDAQGIGTLTFVTQDNKFGALGHAVSDYETGSVIPVKDGKIYSCTMLGITKGVAGKAGELRCLFVDGSMDKGNISKNTECGVFGMVTDVSDIIDPNMDCVVASRLLVKPGKAKLISSVSGVREEYDIEIIKTYNQNKVNNKGFVFRVKDKRLLELTGGIVQGMSGSPIIQDGKLIGAVTHVFLYDSTKGYGVYSDWMMDEVV